MIEILRHIILLYSFFGFFLAGGLFFYKRTTANIFLALYIIAFSLEQLDYLYTTSTIVLTHSHYYLYLYPVCFLFGPFLWLHLQSVKHDDRKFVRRDLIHFIPFVIFYLVILHILKLDGYDRILYTRKNFMSEMMPYNYIRTAHVTIYGIFILGIITYTNAWRNNRRGIYLSLIAIIYFVTAVLQMYLTMFAESYRQFAIFFFLASSIFLIVGYVLFKYPNLMDKLQKKYFTTSINKLDRARIIEKIESSKANSSLLLDNKLRLRSYCSSIGERSHQVSQIFSEEFDTSFTQFVNSIRIRKAIDLLVDPKNDSLKILAIAFECGYNNYVSFHNAFVKETGMTPGAYRTNLK